MAINIVSITGNLTRDPELRVTVSGTQVLSFTVAVNERRRNPQSGEWESYPNFIDCTMFGTRAEAAARQLSKGERVAVMGRLRYSSWEKDGQKRNKLEVIAEEVVPLQAARQDDAAAGAADSDPQVYDEDVSF